MDKSAGINRRQKTQHGVHITNKIKKRGKRNSN